LEAAFIINFLDKIIKMKKSQMIGQVFIYVVTIVIVGLILLFGYNAIVTVKGKSDEIILSKFKSDVANAVEITSSDFGTVKIKSFELPARYALACFVKNYDGFPDPDTNPSTLFNNYPIMKDSVKDKVDKNLFLIEDSVEASFFVGDIDVDDTYGVLCFSAVNNRIRVKIEGKGNHALLAEP